MKYKILTIQQSFLKLENQTKEHQFIIFNHLLSIQFIESQWKCFISSFIIKTSVLTFTKLFKSKQNLWILDQKFLKYIPRKLGNEFCIQIQTTFARNRCLLPTLAYISITVYSTVTSSHLLVEEVVVLLVSLAAFFYTAVAIEIDSRQMSTW